MNGGKHSANDVVDVSVVASRAPVAKHWNRPALTYQAGEFMDREVWSLPRTVDGKKAQADAAQAVEMRVGMTEKFAGCLRCCVWRDRLSNRIVFTERDLCIDAVNG